VDGEALLQRGFVASGRDEQAARARWCRFRGTTCGPDGDEAILAATANPPDIGG